MYLVKIIFRLKLERCPLKSTLLEMFVIQGKPKQEVKAVGDITKKKHSKYVRLKSVVPPLPQRANQHPSTRKHMSLCLKRTTA